MSESKASYNEALKELNLALSHLRRAQKSFESSSNNMDDFPTARHEIMDLAVEVKGLNKTLKDLFDNAYDNRIK